MLNIFIIILTACFSSLNWRVYTDNVNHFKINYPDKWIIQNANGSIVFLSPKEGVQDLSQKRMNLEQYTEVTKKQIIDNLGSSAIISLKSTTLAGQRAKEFIYDMNYQGRSLKLKQYWFIKGNIAYLFSYTARTIEVW